MIRQKPSQPRLPDGAPSESMRTLSAQEIQQVAGGDLEEPPYPSLPPTLPPPDQWPVQEPPPERARTDIMN
jgi:hypothetical protein